MRGRFPGVDCVVVGHLHMPIHREVRGVLLFSPGAVFAPEHDPDFDWRDPRAMAYRRYRRRLPAEARGPAVGLIEVGPGVLRARVIPLLRPIRAPAPGHGPASPGSSRVTRPSATYQAAARRSDSSIGV